MTRNVGTLYVLGLAALAASVGCGASTNTSASAPGGPAAPISAPTQTASTPQPNGSPVVVSCEPNQRTLVRPVVVNGATLSQIECITSTGALAVAQPQAIAAPTYAMAPAPVYQPVPVAQPIAVSSDYGDTRVIAPQRTTRVVRPVQTREVVYREPIRKQRSVKKSAVIIGSSAGVGAGVGAAVGGKKGALLGALIGGGGATVWDQITRRK
jgi:hypothetical protein